MTNFIYQLVGSDLVELNNQLTSYSIKKLGVQGPPGLKFTVNPNPDIETSFMIGHTGIFTFDFSDLSEDIQLQFVANDKNQNLVNNTGNQIIVDIIGMIEEGGNEV